MGLNKPKLAQFPLYLLFIFFHLTVTQIVDTSQPIVTTLNGTYRGLHLHSYLQDIFLGIPYAQPPLGALRFAAPKQLNAPFNGTRDATRYGHSCMQYNSKFDISEDCLTLNVVRPYGLENGTKLPVLVWIYGGGLYAGSTADPQYNLSGIVQTSQEMGKPIVAVSMNYRLGMWGFLQTPQIIAEGSSNAGLLDQRLALHWVKHNIDRFGGDPTKITVWGESAGAQSIAWQLLSYNGRDDSLIHGAILESGGPAGAFLQPLSYYVAPVDNLTRSTGCFNKPDQLGCLRSLSSEALFALQPSQVWNPIVDGEFLTDYPSSLLSQGQYLKIPVITGANSDEGLSFFVRGLNEVKDIFNALMYWRSYALSPPSINKLLDLYPDDPSQQPPYGRDPSLPNSTLANYGKQWRRIGAIGGDLVMLSQRRNMAETYAKAKQSVWSYRFDTPLWNAAAPVGVKHFDNVVFSFQNVSGALGPLPKYQSYKDLSTSIGRAYVNFVHSGDPNENSAEKNETGVFPAWPRYSVEAPKNLVMNANGSFLEEDTWRKEGIAFINSITRELLA